MVYKVTDNLTHRKNMHGAKSDIIWPIDGDSATCNVACWFLHDISNVTLYCKRITGTFCRVSYSAFFLNDLRFNSITSLNVKCICRWIGTIRNALNQILANLFKNHFPLKHKHAKYDTFTVDFLSFCFISGMEERSPV